MLGRVSAFGQGLARNAAAAFSRFPVPTLLVLVFAGLSNLAAAEVWQQDGLERSLAALYLGSHAALAAALWGEGRGSGRFATHGASALAAFLVGMAVLWAEPFGYRVTGLAVATVLAIPLLPFVRQGGSTAFWSFGLWTLVALAVAFASTLLFLVGLYAVVEMARTLLDVALFREADRYVLVTGLTLVSPLVALGRMPDVADITLAADDRLARTIRPLFDWVLAPLVWLSAAVLYLYLLRLALEGGLATPDARWSLGVFCTLALLLRIGADPFLADGPLPSRLFRRWWFTILAVPVLALGLSQWQATQAGGLTPWDYYALLWTASLALAILAQLVPPLRQDIRWIVGIQALMFLLSSFGPWGVVESVTRNQLAAFESGETLRGGDAQSRALLRQRLNVLEDVGTLRDLRALLPPAEADAPLWNRESVSAVEVSALLALDEPSPVAPPPVGTFTAPAGEVVSTRGYDLAVMQIHVGSGFGQFGRLALALEPDGRGMTLRFDGEADRIDLGGLVARFAEVGQTPAEALIWDARTQSGRDVRLWVREATFRSDPARLITLAGAAFLRSEDWPAAKPPN